MKTTNSTNTLSRWVRLFGLTLAIVFAVSAVAISQPTLNTPGDGTSGISTSPSFGWSTAVGDTVYHLQISTSNVFADTVYDDATLTSASPTITGLKNNQLYYWHVNVKADFAHGGATSAYSGPFSFTTWASTPPPVPPPLPVALGAAGRFAVLSYAGVSNTGTSAITGDVGASPIDGTAITGGNTVTVTGTTFVTGPAGPLPSGAYVTNAALLTQAMSDLTTAYNDAAGRSLNAKAVSGNLGGRTLYAGLYKSSGSLSISSGDLTLDAQGDSNAVWIFQMAFDFNMTTGRQVFLSGGAKTYNIFWQVGSGATFGTSTVMKGTILAGTNCTFATGASLNGRALAKTASVTLDGVTFVRPTLPAAYSNPSSLVLGTATDFRILTPTTATIAASCTITGNVAAATLTNSGTINGNAWFTSGPGGGTLNGSSQAVGSTLSTAITDLGTAITRATGLSPNATLGPQLGGSTLGRGVYNSTDGTFDITGTLVLTGAAADTFIFQMTSTLNTGVNSHVMLIGGAVSSNVFWQVGTAATLGASSDFKGIIMAGTSYITQGASATLDGRALAHTSYVTVGGTSVLPVELVSFTGSASGMNAELRWTTATETNNYGFDVERKAVSEWTKVGFVQGSGTSTSAKVHSFVDQGLSSGRYEYRIKQIDNNGSFKYTAAVEVEIGLAPKEFTLSQGYPNPFNPSTTVEFSVARNDQASVKVFNVLGQEVATLFDGIAEAGKLYQTRFDASRMSSGMYYVRLQSNGQSKIQKMVLLK